GQDAGRQQDVEHPDVAKQRDFQEQLDHGLSDANAVKRRRSLYLLKFIFNWIRHPSPSSIA
ncbi:MAG: hypothetical protein ACREKE_04420, partial [bacterium]